MLVCCKARCQSILCSGGSKRCIPDVQGNKLNVDKAWSKKGTKSTKTDEERLVDLTEIALQILHRQKKHTLLSDDDGIIFKNPRTLKPWASPEKLQRNYFGKAVTAVGIPRRTQYNTRHSFACWLMGEGIPTAYIAAQLGHANEQTTLQNYAKWQVSKSVDVMKLRNSLKELEKKKA
jgi:integrase